MANATKLQDLPIEILLMIIPFLSPSELLNFCATCRLFQESEDLRLSPAYWSYITRKTFRLPNRLALKADGRRWIHLYRRMITQTRVYRWGQDAANENLAGGQGPSFVSRRGRVPVARGRWHGRSVGWPVETSPSGNVHIGVVADIQCGGWSTTVLNSSGALFSLGRIEDPSQPNFRLGSSQAQTHGYHALTYPTGYPAPSDRYEPSTAIAQFSAGRSHVLGLSDSGKIWTWEQTTQPGRHVKFVSTDLLEGESSAIRQKNGYVTKVVAGWGCSTAYINGTGIVVWEPSNSAEILAEADLSAADGMMVLKSCTVPFSQYRRNHNPTYTPDDVDLDYLATRVGEVTNYVVLEVHLVFITDLGKVFVTNHREREAEPRPATLEIIRPTLSLGSLTDPLHEVVDIYGSFRRFGLIKRNGEVLVDPDDLLSTYWDRKIKNHRREGRREFDEEAYASPVLMQYPCLQNTGVIAMAFGDWHYHALHADGTISSYGKEAQYSGSLGLGNYNRVDTTRGVFSVGTSGGKIHESCYNRIGRKVHFETEKEVWLNQIRQGLPDPDEAEERRAATASRPELGVHVSEWFEEKLSGWEQGPSNLGHSDAPATEKLVEDDDDLPAYFALSVAAAGWRSAALVLVNDAKAERIRQEYIKPAADMSGPDVPDMAGDATYGYRRLHLPEGMEWIWANDTFPRLKLPDGEIMPGTTPVVDRSHVTNLFSASDWVVW